MPTLLENPNQEREGINVKVKVFTHNDLDGIGCSIVAKRAFGSNNVSVEYCKYEDVDDRVSQFLFSEDYENYDAIFITDISVGESLAEIIESSFAGKVQLIDHHGTATWLNKYGWACVQETEPSLPGVNDNRDNRMSSGTSLLFHYLWDNKLTQDEDMIDLVEQIRRYDTWEWKNVFGGDSTPKQLNDLFYLIGRFEFVDRFVAKPSPEFNQVERKLLEVEQKRIEYYIKSKRDKIFDAVIADKSAGVVFAEQYHSELGNVLAEENPQLDFIVLVSPEGKLSFRGTGKADLDLGEEIAKLFDGGGHPNAAGGKFDYNLSKLFMQVVLKK